MHLNMNLSVSRIGSGRIESNRIAQILADALKNNDPKTAFDVLWEIEAYPLFVEASAEEAARDAGEADEKGSKKSSSKDKDKKKAKVDTAATLCILCRQKRKKRKEGGGRLKTGGTEENYAVAQLDVHACIQWLSVHGRCAQGIGGMI